MKILYTRKGGSQHGLTQLGDKAEEQGLALPCLHTYLPYTLRYMHK
jgi:hypothetical protein